MGLKVLEVRFETPIFDNSGIIFLTTPEFASGIGLETLRHQSPSTINEVISALY